MKAFSFRLCETVLKKKYHSVLAMVSKPKKEGISQKLRKANGIIGRRVNSSSLFAFN